MPLSPYYHGPTPSDLGKGSFGSVAPYTCQDCGAKVWSEPELDTLSRPTRWEPGEYAYRCPHCGRHDISEVEAHPRVCHVTNRTTISRVVRTMAA